MALKLSYWKQSPLQFGRQRAASTLQETSFMTLTTASTAKTGVAASARTVVRAVRVEVSCMMKIEWSFTGLVWVVELVWRSLGWMLILL